MQALQSKLTSYSTGLMDDPNQGIAQIRTTALDNTNRAYADMPSRLSSRFASRGYGSSGDFGGSLYKTEYERGGSISNIEAQLAAMVNDNRKFGAGLGERLLQSGKGSTTTGTGPSTALSDGFQSAGNGLSNISTLLTLQKILKGGGVSGGGSGGGGIQQDYEPDED